MLQSTSPEDYQTQGTSDSTISQLREIFPTRPLVEIETVLSTSQSFEVAVEGLLDSDTVDEEGTTNRIEMEQGIHAT